MSSGPEVLSLIERKRAGGDLADSEIRWLVDAFSRDQVPDYQMAAWLMAVCWRGLDSRETHALTRAMAESGETLSWNLDRALVDKHSTGGVGDKTSLVLVPLLAAAGVGFVKMSGRGLGHTGGTIDKLESIPGFRTGLPIDEIQRQVRRIGCAIVGQTADLVPADRRMYALRGLTATVSSIPLIAASIMSKKLAAGAGSIVLDVKWGRGAFLETKESARELARMMIAIGERDGRRIRAVLSPMDAPLGHAVGNALEVREAIDTLSGQGPADLRELTLHLGSHLLAMAERVPEREARDALVDLLENGAALEHFRTLIAAQGGAPEVVEEPSRLPRADRMQPVLFPADSPAWVQTVDAHEIARVVLDLGGGRRTKEGALDHSVGVVLRARTGDRVSPDEPIAELHMQNGADIERHAAALRAAYRWSADPVPAPTLDLEDVRA